MGGFQIGIANIFRKIMRKPLIASNRFILYRCFNCNRLLSQYAISKSIYCKCGSRKLKGTGVLSFFEQFSILLGFYD